MFPFFSPDPVIQQLLEGVLALILHIWHTMRILDDAILSDVLSLREFAGVFFPDPTTGYAQGWAIVVDDLLDLCLRILGLDPLAVRGDH